MGANSTKYDAASEDEFKTQLLKVFKVATIKDIGVINKAKLEEIWSTILTDQLINLYSCYIERKVISRKKYDDKKVFYNIYSTLVKGQTSEAAELLCCLFSLKSKQGTPEGSDSFPVGELKNYIIQLMSSFLKSLGAENDNVLKAWSKCEVSFNESIQEDVADYIVKDLACDENMVGIDNLEKWLIKSSVFSSFQTDVLMRAYCIYNKTGVTQNHLAIPDFGPISRTRLDIHHILYLTNCLTPELRIKWRLLYSSRYSGESWVIFLRNILNQGPTLLFIWDKTGKCFGGFASSSWSISPQFYGDDNCFLFTLLPTLNKFDATNYNNNFQYINTAQATFPNGLGMGGQLDYWGLYIDSTMKLGKVSFSCSTFANYKQPTEATFDIEDIEVWGVGEKPVSLEPETRQRSALDSQTEAKAVLEMMGKRQVSEGLREPDPVDDE